MIDHYIVIILISELYLEAVEINLAIIILHVCGCVTGVLDCIKINDEQKQSTY